MALRQALRAGNEIQRLQMGPLRAENALRLPEDKAAEVRALQLGEPERYTNTYFDVIEPFLTPPLIAQSRLLHRLPVWLIILPLPNKLVPCLYAATCHPGGFYPGQKYPLTDNSLHPFFVASIGPTLGEDVVYLPEAEDEYDTFYVLASPTEISATGARVDDSIPKFQCELRVASLFNELPEWLEEQPVQRFLKLTPESDMAMSFALASRGFVGRKSEGGDGTVFRPALPLTTYEATIKDEAGYTAALPEVEKYIKNNGGQRLAGGFNKAKLIDGTGAVGNRYVIVSWPNAGQLAGALGWTVGPLAACSP
jgi:hypothetical protein